MKRLPLYKYDNGAFVCSSVCQVPVAEGKSVQQTVDVLHKKLEQLGAVKQGSFCVDCETYHATGNVTGTTNTKVVVDMYHQC